MTVAVILLVVAGVVLAAVSWRAPAGARSQLVLVLAMVAALVVAALLVLVKGPSGWGDDASRTLLVLLALLAVGGGGPLSVLVLSVADHAPAAVGAVPARGDRPPGDRLPGDRLPGDRPPDDRPPDDPPPEADQRPQADRRPEDEPLEDGEVLRGGAWIGTLERAGIFATLAAGWPEGVAVVLAVKGVGRYHELGETGAAERFIIGTFASVLWASACAALWWFG